jgi:hypothetical protein
VTALRAPLLALAILAAACSRKEREFGVDVFSTDTLPARIYMELTGTLQMGLRADNYFTTADKSLILLTPASLIVQKGEGTATIFSIDSTQRLAVQPLGMPPDSADRAGVTGRVVKLTRAGERKTVQLEVVKP